MRRYRRAGSIQGIMVIGIIVVLILMAMGIAILT
jgi:hypothetical protein